MAKSIRYEGEPIRPETITFEEVTEARRDLEHWTELDRQVGQVRERCFADEKRAQSRLRDLQVSLTALITKVAFGEAERSEFDTAKAEILQCEVTVSECELLKPGIANRFQQVSAMKSAAQKLVVGYDHCHAALLSEMQDRLVGILTSGYDHAVKFYGAEKIQQAIKFVDYLLHEEKRLGRETAGLKHGLDAVAWAHRVKEQIRQVLEQAKAERPPEDLPLQHAKRRLGDLAAWVS